MTKSWTDERLEERFDAIDRRFDRVDTDIRDLRGEMNARFDTMNVEMKAGFERVDERFEAMHRLMVQGGIVIIAALLGLVGTQL